MKIKILACNNISSLINKSIIINSQVTNSTLSIINKETIKNYQY